MIHQNRAHERVLYEKYLKELSTEGMVSQKLLFPYTMEMSTTEVLTIKEMQEDLSAFGFHIVLGPDENTVNITATPSFVTSNDVGTVLENIISEFQQEKLSSDFNRIDGLAKYLARTSAVKTGELLSKEAQSALVNDLFGCVDPIISPFSKKLMWP